MGTGANGGFGHTVGARRSNIFTRTEYTGSVKVMGEERDVSRRVYQRNDIDFEQYNPKHRKTNLQLMEEGRPPIGNDGRPVHLHHVIQRESGPVVEIREVTHREYKKTLHGLVGNGGSFRNDPILSKQFNNFRSAYWKWRADEYKRKGGKR